jgi:hypothetical protein
MFRSYVIGDSHGDSPTLVFRRCVGGPAIERCGAELLSGLLPEGKVRKKASIWLFREIAARREDSRDCQTAFAECHTSAAQSRRLRTTIGQGLSLSDKN